MVKLMVWVSTEAPFVSLKLVLTEMALFALRLRAMISESFISQLPSSCKTKPAGMAALADWTGERLLFETRALWGWYSLRMRLRMVFTMVTTLSGSAGGTRKYFPWVLSERIFMLAVSGVTAPA